MIKNLPFEFKAWDLQDTFCWTFYDVTFTQPFGLIEAGQTFKFLEIDLDAGRVKTYKEDGIEVLNEIAVEILPIELKDSMSLEVDSLDQ